MNHGTEGLEARRVFAALADGTRFALLGQLQGSPSSASRLAEPLGISRQAVAKHLQVLADAGLLRQWREGRETIFEIRLAGLEPAVACLGALRAAEGQADASRRRPGT